MQKVQFKLAQADRRYEVASSDLREVDREIASLESTGTTGDCEWKLDRTDYMQQDYSVL